MIPQHFHSLHYDMHGQGLINLVSLKCNVSFHVVTIFVQPLGVKCNTHKGKTTPAIDGYCYQAMQGINESDLFLANNRN